ncbi:4-hydroxy-tetrahydrodipicolinate synthase [Salisediminibacterium beveridgei]|uniref:4-hydroxy-tetrahydrodipicolinate synthase n=1 Tax=Salisediminibacterium beveridgei TaxID=632773 RepID=A0A1D7QVC0_9BACI|nr:4-hydroxy-tetrahydrodipicolinate synthase [Salisediminibacterium beveridgei]AOM82960.1 Dihydrodipicolinate synthase [Salisediminibacterium beveridgei]
MNFGQMITAMVTPFNDDLQIDFDRTEQLIEHLISTGSDAVVLSGTTGEAPTLSIDEKNAFFRFCVKIVDGRIPVLAGTGTNSTKAAIELTKMAEIAGAEGVMLMAPYYNKPNQQGMYEHFKAVATSTVLPVMLYNVPGRTGVNLLPETTIKLSRIPNIVSIKEASGDLDAMSMIIEETSDDFSVYSGDDSLTLPSLAVGADGVVSVSSHVIGDEIKEMIEAANDGDLTKASAIHRRLVPMMNAMFIAPSPSPIKAALNMIGVPVGSVRLPIVDVDESEREAIYNQIAYKRFSSAV